MSALEKLWDPAAVEQALEFIQPDLAQVNPEAVFVRVGDSREVVGIQLMPEDPKYSEELHFTVFHRSTQGETPGILSKQEQLITKLFKWRERCEPRWVDVTQFVLPFNTDRKSFNTLEEFMQEYHMNDGSFRQIYPSLDQAPK